MGNNPVRRYRVVRKPDEEEDDHEFYEAVGSGSLSWVASLVTCCASVCTLLIVIALFAWLFTERPVLL